jgi:hypothetical protein
MPVVSSSRFRPAFVLGTLALALCSSSCGVFCAPRPSVTLISPASAIAGESQFLLTVDGKNFRFDSFVTWNGGFRPTTFINSHQLIAIVFAADIATPGVEQVGTFTPPGETETFVFVAPEATIVNTRCGGGSSNILAFTVKP